VIWGQLAVVMRRVAVAGGTLASCVGENTQGTRLLAPTLVMKVFAAVANAVHVPALMSGAETAAAFSGPR
jgi:hypothetical protein